MNLGEPLGWDELGGTWNVCTDLREELEGIAG